MELTPYLSFNGNCAEAFRFYERVLGGTLEMMTHGQSPMAGEVPSEQHDRIMHARLEAKGAVIMGADAPAQYATRMDGFCVTIGIENEAEAERLFGALSDGGKVQMPLQETFWAKRFGMLMDRYGTPWMVNCSKPM